MRLEDFSGWRLKRDLGVDKANKIYHNRHVDGSGNFGYLMVKANVWFRIDAEYTPAHEITWISISTPDLRKAEFIKGDEYSRFVERARRFIRQLME